MATEDVHVVYMFLAPEEFMDSLDGSTKAVSNQHEIQRKTSQLFFGHELNCRPDKAKRLLTWTVSAFDWPIIISHAIYTLFC